MPVDHKHDGYTAQQERWDRIRAVLSGGDVVKSMGAKFLPKPKGLTDADYADYLMRAEFYSATARTVDGLAGSIFRKAPQIEIPAGSENLIEQATMRGEDLTTFSKRLIREVISIGRFGVLVDVEDTEQRPFLAGYRAENIINWRVSMVGQRPVLSLVVLREPITAVSNDDPYKTEMIERFRVLELMINTETSTPVYVQKIFEKRKEDKEPVQIGDDIIPLRRGKTLDSIPFIFFGPIDLSPECEKSPILDLVDTNLSHYRTSAELEEGAYFTGLPMYVISGRLAGGNETPGKFQVGSRSAVHLEEGGNAQVLTVSGDGMGLLRSLMEDKEKRMAVLGARILEDQKAGVEAADTVKMRHRSENSLLASIADTCSRGLSEAIERMIWWAGTDNPQITFELNRDFVSTKLSPQELVQLVAAYQQGAFGPEVMFQALKDGERVPNEWGKEDWLNDIDDGQTALEQSLGNAEFEPFDVVSSEG